MTSNYYSTTAVEILPTIEAVNSETERRMRLMAAQLNADPRVKKMGGTVEVISQFGRPQLQLSTIIPGWSFRYTHSINAGFYCHSPAKNEAGEHRVYWNVSMRTGMNNSKRIHDAAFDPATFLLTDEGLKVVVSKLQSGINGIKRMVAKQNAH